MAIEFALILPVLIVILAGMIQFGLAFFLQNNMVNAAREAARQLAVGDATVATAPTVATGYLAGWGGMTFTVTACDPDNAGANCAVGTDDVAVEITVPRSQVAVADILGIFGSGTMKAKVVMRQE